MDFDRITTERSLVFHHPHEIAGHLTETLDDDREVFSDALENLPEEPVDITSKMAYLYDQIIRHPKGKQDPTHYPPLPFTFTVGEKSDQLVLGLTSDGLAIQPATTWKLGENVGAFYSSSSHKMKYEPQSYNENENLAQEDSDFFQQASYDIAANADQYLKAYSDSNLKYDDLITDVKTAITRLKETKKHEAFQTSYKDMPYQDTSYKVSFNPKDEKFLVHRINRGTFFNTETLEFTLPDELDHSQTDFLRCYRIMQPYIHHLNKNELLPSDDRKKALREFSMICWSDSRINKNKANLLSYIEGEDFVNHTKTSKIYYPEEMPLEDVVHVASFREPVNLFLISRYHQEALFDFFKARGMKPHKQTVFFDRQRMTKSPNTIGIYSETVVYPYLTKNKEKYLPQNKPIACLSIPFPMLGVPEEPYHPFYFPKGNFSKERYQTVMEQTAKIIFRAASDHCHGAFDQKGIGRIIIPLIDKTDYFQTIPEQDRQQARNAFYEALKSEYDRQKEHLQGIDILLLDHEGKKTRSQSEQEWTTIAGNIVNVLQEYDFIINFHKCYTSPGNGGGERDNSIDGCLGKTSGVLLMNPWLNHFLSCNATGKPNYPQRYIAVQ